MPVDDLLFVLYMFSTVENARDPRQGRDRGVGGDQRRDAAGMVAIRSEPASAAGSAR
jgi:hypothetical protein